MLKKINNNDELIYKYKNKNILLIHSITNSNEVNILSYIYENNNFQKLDNVLVKKINYELF